MVYLSCITYHSYHGLWVGYSELINGLIASASGAFVCWRPSLLLASNPRHYIRCICITEKWWLNKSRKEALIALSWNERHVVSKQPFWQQYRFGPTNSAVVLLFCSLKMCGFLFVNGESITLELQIKVVFPSQWTFGTKKITFVKTKCC